ncbi:MAG: NADP-dependent oxidoreductase [Rhodoglobus sp.]|nr:NADP-dependent oxidoreductase [Rhodoglobus sp.]
MKAVVLGAFDEAPSITELDVPAPEEGEIRVRVRAASVNGFDLAVANGYMNGMMEHRFPVVLGKDFAGTVDAVGDGVEGFAVGDRVFGVVTKPFLGDGSFAEFVTVPVSVGVAKIPQALDFAEAAALGLAGTAAVMAFDAADIQQGHTVLITGATGGVGNQALQLAVQAGATVIATASSVDEVAQVTDAGADLVVDYKGDVAAQVHATYPAGVDVVLHFAGDPASLVGVIKPGGRLVSTLVQSPEQVPAEGITVVPVYANPTGETLDRLARNQRDKHTTVTIQSVFTLEETPKALGQFAEGTLGKLVISISN